MKSKVYIAIHHTEETYSERWIEYCKKNNYKYRLVDCYSSDIIRQLEGCSHFLWHFHHHKIKDMLFAKQLLYSVEKMGIKVFPNFNTVWHFDDKVGQKYLLESVGAPLVNSYIFYDKNSALEWLKTTTFPIVFKLRGGSSSENVKLIRSKNQAIDCIRKAFSRGFNSRPLDYRMKENLMKFKRYKSFFYLRETLAGLKNYIFPTNQQKFNVTIEKGYLYFQDFLPNNEYDIRVVVVGKRAVGMKRFVRKGDFRASGSGLVEFDENEIDNRCVKIAFDVSKKLNSQSVVYDFIFDQNNEPKIVEISYASLPGGYDFCKGYWDSDMKWHSGSFKYEYWMLEDLINLK